MNRKDVINIFRREGWKCRRGYGVYVCVIALERVTVCTLVNLRKIRDYSVLVLGPQLVTDEFSTVAHYILPSDVADVPIVIMEDIIIEERVMTPEVVGVAINNMIESVRAEDVEVCLSAYRNLPTDCIGDMPCRHLAALALAGDVERLQSYITSFKKGDRLGFVPYVDLSAIERSVEVSLRYAKGCE